MKIYTMTGDKGSTGLIGGVRLAKSEAVFHLLGELDELNAALGWAAVHPESHDQKEGLHRSQRMLLELGSVVAGASSHAKPDEECIWLEQSIDALTAATPPLTQFILPGGGEAAARLHLARAICRRAERRLAESAQAEAWLPWLNRLSDWLFSAARANAHSHGYTEEAWSPQSP